MKSSADVRAPYFPGLDTLRCFAAYGVVLYHLEALLHWRGVSNFHYYAGLHRMGDQGVRFFFVLSGYLITFLLLRENSFGRTESISKFYLRRILRIWPCYYLTLLIGLVILPRFPELAWKDAFEIFKSSPLAITTLYVTMLPNIVFEFFGQVPYVSAAWSIGVEEQFYALWPVLFCFVRNRVWFISLLTFLFWLKPMTFFSLNSPGLSFFLGQPFHFLTLGALFAHIHHEEWKALLRPLFHPITQIFSYLIVLVFLLYPYHWNLPAQAIDLTAIFYGVIILNVSANASSILKWEWSVTRYLGRISYGIYMYHLAAFAAAIWFTEKIAHSGSLEYAVVIRVFGVMFPALAAGVSYRFLERPFLRLKTRFSATKTPPSWASL